MKKIAIAALAAATMLTFSMSLFADSTGWRQNSTGWWYATNNAGTTWYSNGWQWIDGNNDGIAECYYFDSNGYALTNATTPDGYTVNADGAWTVNGVVQTKQVTAAGGSDSSTTSSGGAAGSSGSSTGVKFNDFDWKIDIKHGDKRSAEEAELTVSKYLGVYTCTSRTDGVTLATDGSYLTEFAILSDGRLHNSKAWNESYASGTSRVSDTKWANTRANITTYWEILDNGKKIREYDEIGGKFSSEAIFSLVG